MPVPQYARSCSEYRSRLVPGSLFAANMICVEILLNDLHVFEVYGLIDALRYTFSGYTPCLLCSCYAALPDASLEKGVISCTMFLGALAH